MVLLALMNFWAEQIKNTVFHLKVRAKVRAPFRIEIVDFKDFKGKGNHKTHQQQVVTVLLQDLPAPCQEYLQTQAK